MVSMETTPEQIAGIGDVIRLAVAPVFLLAGVGAMLNVLAARLARIVDRARLMEELLTRTKEDQADDLRRRLRILAQRARWINRAMTLCVVTALSVTLVVVALFVDAFVNVNLSLAIGALFAGGMLSFALGQLYFLREVFVATASLRIGEDHP